MRKSNIQPSFKWLLQFLPATYSRVWQHTSKKHIRNSLMPESPSWKSFTENGLCSFEPEQRKLLLDRNDHRNDYTVCKVETLLIGKIQLNSHSTLWAARVPNCLVFRILGGHNKMRRQHFSYGIKDLLKCLHVSLGWECILCSFS